MQIQCNRNLTHFQGLMNKCLKMRSRYQSAWECFNTQMTQNGVPILFPSKGINEPIAFLKCFPEFKYSFEIEPYLVPKRREMLSKSEGFNYSKLLHLNMVYYFICIRKQESNICTIILPWGKYRYKHLPMGVSNSPDISSIK